MANKIKKAMKKNQWELINQITDTCEQEQVEELTQEKAEEEYEHYFDVFVKQVLKDIK